MGSKWRPVAVLGLAALVMMGCSGPNGNKVSGMPPAASDTVAGSVPAAAAPPAASAPETSGPPTTRAVADSPAPGERRQELPNAVRWDFRGERWTLGLLAASWLDWALLPDPGGRTQAIVVRTANQDLLVGLDLESGEVQVLAEQARPYGKSGDEGPLSFYLAGWHDGRLLVLRPAPAANGVEQDLIVEAYDPDDLTANRIARLPWQSMPDHCTTAWVAGDKLHIIRSSGGTGELWQTDLASGQARLLRSDAVLAPDSGCVWAHVSPAGDRVFWGWPDALTDLVDATTGADLPLAPAGIDVHRMEWSRDGNRLAQCISGGAYPAQTLAGGEYTYTLCGALRIAFRSGEELAVAVLPGGQLVNEVRWLPDNRRVLVTAGEGRVDKDDPGEWQVLTVGAYLMHDNGDVAEVPGWSPGWGSPYLVGDGWALFYDSDVSQWRVESLGGAVPPLPDSRGGKPALLPSGELAVWDGEGAVWACRPGAAACRRLPEVPGNRGYRLKVAGPWLMNEEYAGGLVWMAGVRWSEPVASVEQAFALVAQLPAVREIRNRLGDRFVMVLMAETPDVYEISVGENAPDVVHFELHLDVNRAHGTVAMYDWLTGEPLP